MDNHDQISNVYFSIEYLPTAINTVSKVFEDRVPWLREENERWHEEFISQPGDMKPDVEETTIDMIRAWPSARYHFVMDCLFSTLTLGISDEQLKMYKLAVPQDRTYDFKKQWIFLLYPFLTERNLVNVGPTKRFFKKIIKARQQWPRIANRQKILKSANRKISNNLNLQESTCRLDCMILIKRNHSRQLRNWPDVYNLCKNFCMEHGLKLEVFDDSKPLGTVVEQVKKFHHSKIIIGCHGAAFSNLIGCTSATTLIEFIQTDRIPGGGSNLTQDSNEFETMSTHLGMNYHKINKTNGVVNVDQINKILKSMNKY